MFQLLVNRLSNGARFTDVQKSRSDQTVTPPPLLQNPDTQFRRFVGEAFASKQAVAFPTPISQGFYNLEGETVHGH